MAMTKTSRDARNARRSIEQNPWQNMAKTKLRTSSYTPPYNRPLPKVADGYDDQPHDIRPAALKWYQEKGIVESWEDVEDDFTVE